MAAAAAMAAPLANPASGAAMRARERKKRAVAKKVGWLTALLQAQQPHHSDESVVCPGCIALAPKVAHLDRTLQKLMRVVDTGSAELSVLRPNLEHLAGEEHVVPAAGEQAHT